MPEEQRIIQIGAALTARKEPGQDAWEIRDSEAVLGRVVEMAGGFKALKPGPDGGYYGVGTFISVESAGKALRD